MVPDVARIPGQNPDDASRPAAAAVSFLLVFALSVPFYLLGMTGWRLPGLPFSALLGFVPMVAAMVLVARSGRGSAVFQLLARLFDPISWTGVMWLVLAVIFMPVVCLIEYGMLAQKGGAVLGARKAVKKSMIALELSLRRLLWNFGLKVGTISPSRFALHIRELAVGNPMLQAATEPMLRARSSLRNELAGLERRVRPLAQDDPVCRRLMSMPGIGAVVALTFRSALDNPARFTSSNKVGPWIGLTP